jgi:transcriptional regulator with XRE-family HTH domain
MIPNNKKVRETMRKYGCTPSLLASFLGKSESYIYYILRNDMSEEKCAELICLIAERCKTGAYASPKNAGKRISNRLAGENTKRVLNEIKELGLSRWKAAYFIGFSEGTLYRKLRFELSESEANEIIEKLHEGAKKYD